MVAASGLYERVEQFIIRSYTNAKRPRDILHAQRTVFWLKRLEPEADEILQIAAVAHDIERAFRDPHLEGIIADSAEGFKDPAFLRAHSEKGARIIGDFLAKQNASPEDINRVMQLVAGHEYEGSAEQNLIKDADSLSNFETIAELFIKYRADTFGKEKVREKFDWMFNRISSPKAREIALPMYRKAIQDLEKKFSAEE